MKIPFRITAVILILVMTVSFFSGCSFTSSKDKTVEITLYDQNSKFSGYVTGWFADILKEKWNVSLVFREANDYGFTSYIAQGNLGDIIIFSNDKDYETVRDAGLLLDWEGYGLLDSHGSFLSTNYPAALEKNRSMNSDDKLYGISGNISLDGKGHSDFLESFYFRWDLYQELGYPQIDTLEDFIPVLKDMTALAQRDSERTVYALSTFNTWDYNMMNLASATCSLYGYEEFGFGLYNPSTDSYEECIDPDGIYVRCLRFYNRLYREGLIDPASFTQNYEKAQEQYANGRAVFGIYDYISASPYNTSGHFDQGKYMASIVAKDFSNICYQNSIYGDSSIFSIGSTAKHPDLCLDIISWLFTPEGTLTTLYGPQKAAWDYDSNGLPYITDYGYQCKDDTSLDMPEGFSGTYEEGFISFACSTINPDSEIPGTNGMTFNDSQWPSTISSDWYKENHAASDSLFKQWSDYTKCSDENSYIENNGYTLVPATMFSMDSLPMDYVLNRMEIETSICTYSWDAIQAASDSEFDDIISDMQKDCKSRHYDEVMNFYHEQLSEYRELLTQ